MLISSFIDCLQARDLSTQRLGIARIIPLPNFSNLKNSSPNFKILSRIPSTTEFLPNFRIWNEFPNLKRIFEFETNSPLSQLEMKFFKTSALNVKRGRLSVKLEIGNSRLWFRISEFETNFKRIWNEFRIELFTNEFWKSESKLPNSELYRIRIAIPSLFPWAFLE